MLPARVGRIRLQARDIAILRGLFECRVMTIDHAAALYFEARREYAKKRLQKLKIEGLIGERPRLQFERSVLFIKTKGLIALRQEGILDLYPDLGTVALTRRAQVSEMTLRHELAVMDLKVAFHLRANCDSSISVLEFTTWPLLNQFDVNGSIVKPDAFVRLNENLADGTREHCFFVELDRSTEPFSMLCARAQNYRSFAVQKASFGRIGRPSPFRVLYILQSRERRDNLARRLADLTPPIHSLVWLAAFHDVMAEPFGGIWSRPIDYKVSVLTGTSSKALIAGR